MEFGFYGIRHGCAEVIGEVAVAGRFGTADGAPGCGHRKSTHDIRERANPKTHLGSI